MVGDLRAWCVIVVVYPQKCVKEREAVLHVIASLVKSLALLTEIESSYMERLSWTDKVNGTLTRSRFATVLPRKHHLL